MTEKTKAVAEELFVIFKAWLKKWKDEDQSAVMDWWNVEKPKIDEMVKFVKPPEAPQQ